MEFKDYDRPLCVSSDWRFSSAGRMRVRHMRQREHDSDVVPEMSALMVDMLQEMDALRARLRCAGTE